MSARKEWTKTMAILRLRDIEKSLSDVEQLANSGGKMPAALRKKLQNTLNKVQTCKQSFEEWQP